MAYLRTHIEATTLPVSFGRELCAQLAIIVEGNVFKSEETILADGINANSTRGTTLYADRLLGVGQEV